jgi:hypothetical protein
MAKKEMLATYSLDIVNAEKNKWDDNQWLNFVRDRLVKMRAKRKPYDRLWDEAETQNSAVSFYD